MESSLTVGADEATLALFEENPDAAKEGFAAGLTTMFGLRASEVVVTSVAPVPLSRLLAVAAGLKNCRLHRPGWLPGHYSGPAYGEDIGGCQE